MMNIDNDFYILKQKIEEVENKKNKIKLHKIYRYLELRKVINDVYDLEEFTLNGYYQKLLKLKENNEIPKDNDFFKNIEKFDSDIEKLERNIFTFLKFEVLLVFVTTILFGLLIYVSLKSNYLQDFDSLKSSNSLYVLFTALVILLGLGIQKKWRENIEEKVKVLKKYELK